MPDGAPAGHAPPRPAWAEAARAALAAGPAAMVTVLATEGSAPRGAGTRMVVRADAATGTIGGGALEHVATAQARMMLDRPPGTWRVQDYPLGPLLGQCCGGRVRLLVERLDPRDTAWLDAAASGRTLVSRLTAGGIARRVDASAPVAIAARGALPVAGALLAERLEERRRPLLLFGAGHVGRAIARACTGLPLALAWFDARADAAETPGVALVAADALPGCARDAPEEAAVLILTHDHALDYAIAAAALAGAARFVGLIGSATKRARFLSRLAGDGIEEAMRARLVCPIGLPGIAGKEPEVIAVAVVAQLLALGQEPRAPS